MFSLAQTLLYLPAVAVNGALGAAAGSVSRWLAAHPSYMQNVNRASAGLFIASGAAVLLLDLRK